MKSSEIKLQTSKKINITFRHLHSNYHFSDELYYNFFQFILNLKDNKSFEDEVEKILDFVNSSYPSISEKKIIILLKKSSAFLYDSELNSNKYLQWSYQGECSFEIDENGNPIFLFENTKIFLRNNDNFKSLSNVKGFFDIYSNSLNCEFAEKLIKNENFDLSFVLSDFVIDLDKKYFSAKKSSMISRNPLNGNFNGTYSSKLNNKSQLPNFNSSSKESFTLYDEIKFTGFVNLINDEFIFNGVSNSPASLSFINNQSVYEFYSNSITFSKNKLYSKNLSFLFQIQKGNCHTLLLHSS